MGVSRMAYIIHKDEDSESTQRQLGIIINMINQGIIFLIVGLMSPDQLKHPMVALMWQQKSLHLYPIHLTLCSDFIA